MSVIVGLSLLGLGLVPSLGVFVARSQQVQAQKVACVSVSVHVCVCVSVHVCAHVRM